MYLNFRNAFFGALLILLAITTPHAQANTTTAVTTTSYSSGSSSEDIDISCKSVKIHTSKGEVTASCNDVTSDDHIALFDSTKDLDDYIYCPSAIYGTDTSLTLGTTTSEKRKIVNWNVKTSSNGNDYIVEGQCYQPAGWLSTKSDLNLNTVIKNDDGKLAKK